MGAVTIGVDIGQRVDPTAICVAEDEQRARPDQREREETHFLVRHLERLPLGTPYPRVAERLKAVAAGVRARTGTSAAVYVNATGVGQPVVDLLHATGVGATIYPVYFTHGDRRSQDGYEVRLGKGWLVARLQTLLQSRRIHLPDSAEADAMVEELLNCEIRVSEDANERYGAFTVGTHDDLVTALGLAVQVDPVYPNFRWIAVPRVVGGWRRW